MGLIQFIPTSPRSPHRGLDQDQTPINNFEGSIPKKKYSLGWGGWVGFGVSERPMQGNFLLCPPLTILCLSVFLQLITIFSSASPLLSLLTITLFVSSTFLPIFLLIQSSLLHPHSFLAISLLPFSTYTPAFTYQQLLQLQQLRPTRFVFNLLGFLVIYICNRVFKCRHT